MRTQRGAALAQALVEKVRNDERLRSLDKNLWYSIDAAALGDTFLRDSFVQLSLDEETQVHELSNFMF